VLGEIGLRNYVESGIPLDAAVITTRSSSRARHARWSAHHLEDRVAAAACFLPLTVSPGDRDLGTRHRARLG
jgi:hypothetical protein